MKFLNMYNLKKICSSGLWVLFLVYFLPSLPAAQHIDIGENIDFEYRFMERGNTRITQYRQDINFYLEGYLKDNIEMGARLRSAGIMNSTATVILYEGGKIENLTPFIENAYVRIRDYYGYPVTFTFGKLALNWQEGILINDNRKGLPGVQVEYTAPYGIEVEGYHIRTKMDRYGISDVRGTGLRADRDFDFRNVELNYTVEEYESTEEVIRRVYGGRFTRNIHQGLEYSLFGFLMEGEKGADSFEGRALGAYGRFEGVVDPIGKGGAWIEYVFGSGDYDKNDDERSFRPVLSSVESNLIGDYYGRHREYAYMDGVKSDEITLSHTIANLSSFRNALYATVLEDFHVFWIRSTYKKVEPDLPLGGSITFGGTYNYSFIDFELRYTKFSPEDEYDYYTEDRSTEFITGSISAKF